MPRLDIVQGSPEWHKYRGCHIMATTASCIMGSNPFKTSLDAWKEILGMSTPSISSKKMEEGNTLEPEARKLASELLGIDFQPCVYESDKYSWMAASLDGLSPCGKYILEIKCGKKAHEASINKFIPEYYEDQMTHQLNCCESALQVYYFTYRPENKDKYTIADFFPNKDRKEKMIDYEQKFWIQLCSLQPPEEIWTLKNRS